MVKLRNLTEAETEVLELTARLWNAITALPILHKSDNSEICTLIHGIQNTIAARPYTESQVPHVDKPIPPPDRYLREGEIPKVIKARHPHERSYNTSRIKHLVGHAPERPDSGTTSRQ